MLNATHAKSGTSEGKCNVLLDRKGLESIHGHRIMEDGSG